MSWKLKRTMHALLDAERGTIRKSWGGQAIRMAIAYPNVYYIAMSNLGFQTMYRHINLRPDTICERVFLPDREEEQVYRRQHIPLFSFESQTPVAQFDILAFSISFENDYLNVLKILELSRIPYLAADRDERYPLIMIGGAITYINPEPLADFADLIVVGDGEEVINRYLDRFLADMGRPRQAHLAEAAAIEGIYVPSLFSPASSSRPVVKQRLDRLDEYVAYSAVITPHTEFKNTLLVEISRGCPRLCRFCTVSYIYPKFRMVPAATVLQLVQERKQEEGTASGTAFDRVGLISSATSDYREIETLALGLRELGMKISVSSLRIDKLPEGLLQALVESDGRSLTVAPEAGSERLREVIRKPIPEAKILEGVERMLQKGVQNLKLYFMVGLPTETEEDIEQLIRLTLEIARCMEGYQRGQGHLGELILSINPFIPKPLTPFQWCEMAPPKVVKGKIDRIRKALRPFAHITVKHESFKSAYLEAILARGDRSLSRFLLVTHRCQGDWRRALRELGWSLESFLTVRENQEGKLPWEFIMSESDRRMITRQYERAFSLPLPYEVAPPGRA
ncbi:MAG: radical SAM protein [Nitrospinota bacterium]|nr:MAG: radical SAM protein [Nitrospinota bacterium]